MRYNFLSYFFLALLVSCSSGTKVLTKEDKDSLKNSLVSDSVIVEEWKPIFVVKDNYIDMDSISSFFIYQQFDGDLEHMNAFMSIGYNNNYARIAFDKDLLVVNNDTLYMYNEQRIIGSFMPAFNYDKKIDYLVINDAGDYGEEIDLISIDSLGKIIDCVELISNGGDGGDHYEQRIKKNGSNQYKMRYMAVHYGASDPDTVEISSDEEWLLILEENGYFSLSLISSKKPYYKIYPAEEEFIDKLFGDYH